MCRFDFDCIFYFGFEFQFLILSKHYLIIVIIYSLLIQYSYLFIVAISTIMKVTFTVTSSLTNNNHNTFIPKSPSDENECKKLESCIICYNKFIPLNFYNFKTAFASTCLKCTNKCWQCSDDIGFAKSTIRLISDEIYSQCDYSCCKSYGINIECNKRE